VKNRNHSSTQLSTQLIPLCRTRSGEEILKPRIARMITDKMLHKGLSESIVGAAIRVMNTHDDCKSPIRDYS